MNEHQIVLAAEVTLTSPDFGQLEPMIKATQCELEQIGVNDTPGVAVADSGYWHENQIDNVVSNATQVLIPPDAGKRDTPRRGWNGGRYAFMHTVLAGDLGGGLYRKRKAMVEPVFAQTKHNPADQPVPATRQIRRTLGMAANHCNPQSPQAPQTPPGHPRGLRGHLDRTRAQPGMQPDPEQHCRRHRRVPSHRPRQLCATPTVPSRHLPRADRDARCSRWLLHKPPTGSLKPF
ncbi:MAG TPA: hypothetical protein VNY27_10020 [Solirubrobacteraceae bacterium]|nr:hypothetical protein [Solirubrobacteraceae bacterium]